MASREERLYRSSIVQEERERLRQAVFQFSGSVSLPIITVPALLKLRYQPIQVIPESRPVTIPLISWEANTINSEEVDASRCLEHFLKLADASDDEIFSFTQRYGVLARATQETMYVEGNHSREWLPYLENEMRHADGFQLDALQAMYNYQMCNVLDNQEKSPQRWMIEPVEIYRVYSRMANSFLRIAAALNDAEQNNGEGGSLEDWQTLLWRNLSLGGSLTNDRQRELFDHWYYATERPELKFDWPLSLQPMPSLEVQQHLLMTLLTGWLHRTEASAEMQWFVGQRPSLNVNTRGIYGPAADVDTHNRLVAADQALLDDGYDLLIYEPWRRSLSNFTAIVMHLIAAITSANGVYKCDNIECGKIYEPDNRRPRAGVRRFCCRDCRAAGHLSVARESNRRRRAEEKQKADSKG